MITAMVQNGNNNCSDGEDNEYRDGYGDGRGMMTWW